MRIARTSVLLSIRHLQDAQDVRDGATIPPRVWAREKFPSVSARVVARLEDKLPSFGISRFLRSRLLTFDVVRGLLTASVPPLLDSSSRVPLRPVAFPLAVPSLEFVDPAAPVDARPAMQQTHSTRRWRRIVLVLALAGLAAPTRADRVPAFADAMDSGVGAQPLSLVVADLNRDGAPDVVRADWDSDTATILLGDASGTSFTSSSIATGPRPRSVAAGDFDKDGDPDLLVANSQMPAACPSFPADGAGGFGPLTLYGSASPASLIIGDVNRDGKADLVGANQTFPNSATVSVFLGDGILHKLHCRRRTPVRSQRQISEICRDLAVEAKRMRQLQEQPDELLQKNRRDPASPPRLPCRSGKVPRS
jgi:hypothetical protein